MPATVDLTTLRSRVRWRTDTEAETVRFPTSELDDAINAGLRRYHVHLVRARGQGFPSESTALVTTAKNQETYSLNATFLQLLKVFTTLQSVEVVFHGYEEIETDGLVTGISWLPSSDLAYRLTGQNISFRPVPDGVYAVYLKYLPTAVALVNPGDTVDGVSGLEEFIVAWAAKRFALKQRDWKLAEQMDAEMASAVSDLQGLVHARNAAEPPRMLDVRTPRWSRRLPR